MKASAILPDVAFSNRPVGVKRFQATHRCSVDVAHGLALLFGIGTRALPPWDSRTRWNNLMDGLADAFRERLPGQLANELHEIVEVLMNE